MKVVHVFAGLILSLAWIAGHAAGPSVNDLIEAEATKTLKSLTESDKSAPTPPVLSPAQQQPSVLPPAPILAASDADAGKPKHRDGLFARFGVVPNLSGYLMWNDVIYQVTVGKKIKGYTVVAIDADGANLRSPKGKIKHFESLVDEGFDNGNDKTPQQQAQVTGSPGFAASPLPPSMPTMMPGPRVGGVNGVR
ncbi:hypothetical protein G3O06_01365 [Burkholderia sp. Ac-20345]|uniref:hypothetical protein n=1 Tax=Burkholderia sp. Ac-20345 TaxID=2703891 RepID=UPI00197B127B|nr:hypothetical protein [Burkholderia sp. Ac-20345]MBN3776211.1 hypothetical protein [Burkholderia sp. Ac-20345]